MATLDIKTGEYHQTYDYLAMFGKERPSLVYNFNMSNQTVAKGIDENDVINKSRRISYLYQDEMTELMAKAITSKTNDDPAVVETSNNDSGIEDFAPFKDFNILKQAWADLTTLCSEYIDLYEQHSDIVNAATNNILDADIIKKRLKDKVRLALNEQVK